jgi:hypothetical protein
LKPDLSAWQATLRDTLVERGWQVAAVEQSGEWWCHERWRLRSMWPPRNREALITFLVDPQSEIAQPQSGESRVWAAAASAAPLAHWQDAPREAAVTLARNWEAQMPSFMEYLARLRASKRQV